MNFEPNQLYLKYPDYCPDYSRQMAYQGAQAMLPWQAVVTNNMGWLVAFGLKPSQLFGYFTVIKGRNFEGFDFLEIGFGIYSKHQ